MSIAALIGITVGLAFSGTRAEPQLDLPPLPASDPNPQPEIYYNGQAVTPSQAWGDLDRNARYGPPYPNDERNNDRLGDARTGQTYDERLHYGYAYPAPMQNFSRDTPFSDRYYPSDDVRDDNRRYPNHNYDSTNNNQYDNRFGTVPASDANTNNNNHYYNTYPNGYRYGDNNSNHSPQDGGNYPSTSYLSTPRPLPPGYPPPSQGTPSPVPGAPPQQYQPPRDRFNLNNRYNDPQLQDRRIQIELEKLRNFLVETDQKGSLECSANVESQWNFETNVNQFTQARALASQQRYVDFQRTVSQLSKNINKDLIFDRALYRQLMLLSEVGPNALTLEGLDRYNRIINEMLYIYNSATICAYQQPFQCNLRYIPDLKKIMSESRDWDELQHTWLEYHHKAGREMRDNFVQLITVMNEVAHANNVSNGGEYWYLAYEAGNFRQDVEIVWEQIRPLYELLHSYVRRKLRDYYGPERIHPNAPLPSHILGNMYGQSWSNILDIIIPYPGRKLVDVTPRMLEQGYTPLTMFQLAEEFFTSINMSALGPEFYQNSLFEQPIDRQVLCEPSAWDFCNRHDFRVKLCTDINQKSLISVHHEMAHIQYFLQYRHLPKIFRNGANPAFHQAIGDAIGLSISTPKHLQTIGLLQRSAAEGSYDINYLFTMAIDKVAFLPFALALDNWRYDVFSGAVPSQTMNCHFWNLRERYSGIKPPVLRSEMDFDLGAKYHIPANLPYIKYFVSTVLQFQLYRAMCRVSGQYVPNDPRRPLHKCDIYRQPAAGNLLKEIMSKGTSQPWQEVLQETLGEGRLDGSALREYFQPLEEWLRLESLRTNEHVGWNYDGDYCRLSIETANLKIFGGYYNGAQTLHTPTFHLWFLSAAAGAILLHYSLLLRQHV